MKTPCLFLLLALPASAATHTWDGGGSDNRWTTAANWVGDAAPAGGDALRFPAGAAQTVSVNDFTPGFSFTSLTVEGAGYEFTGNAMELTGGVSTAISGGGFVSIGFRITAAAAQTWSVTAGSVCEFSAAGGTVLNAALTLDTPSPGFIRLNGVVSGSAALTKTGSGTLFISGDNTFTGAVTVQQGTLNCTHSNALGGTAAGTAFHPDTLLVVAGAQSIAEPLTVNGAILDCAGGEPSLTGPLTLAGNCTLRAFSGRLIVSGPVTGTGNLSSIGQTRLTGAAANNWAGDASINFGTLQLGKASGTAALPGSVTVANNGRLELLASHQVPDTAVVTLGANARLVIPAGVQETIGGLVMQSSQVENAGELTINGDVSVPAGPATASISGTVHVQNTAQPAAGRTWAPAAGAVLNVTGPLLGHELRFEGPGEMRCSGTGSSIPMRLVSGLLTWNADAPASSIIMESGTLRGDGRTGSLTTNTFSPKRLEPGLSPGLFRTADFTGATSLTLAVELNGTTRGTAYDSLDVAGSTVAPIFTKLEVSVGYPAAIGDTFTILNNTTSLPVNGTFFSAAFIPLSEGRIIAAPGNHYLRVSYTGGDGNDVTLTKVPPPPATIRRFSAVPGTGSIAGFTVVSINAAAAAGITYRLEGSTDLNAWSLITTFSGDNAGAINADFTEPSRVRRFYRFVVP